MKVKCIGEMDSEIHTTFSDIAECFKDTEKNEQNGTGPLGLCFIYSVFLHPQCLRVQTGVNGKDVVCNTGKKSAPERA